MIIDLYKTPYKGINNPYNWYLSLFVTEIIEILIGWVQYTHAL